MLVEPDSEMVPEGARSILLVDDNHDLLQFLVVELKQAGWQMLTAQTALQAKQLFSRLKPDVAVVDYMLGDDDGLELALELLKRNSRAEIIMMTGGGLSEEGVAICAASNIPILYKPFLADDIFNLVRGRPYQSKTAVK